MAGSVVGEVFVGITPSTKGFGAQVVRDIKPVIADVQKSAMINMGLNTKQFETGLANIKGQILKIGAMVGIGFGLEKGYQFLKDSVDLSKEAEQIQRQTNVVFGANADEVTRWAENSVKALGLSKAGAEALAAKTGQILSGFGLDASAKQITDLVQREADLASKSGVDAATVNDAIDQALAGRTRGLKQLGIVIDATAIKDKAASMGLMSKTVDQEKVTAATDTLARKQDAYNKALAASKDPNQMAELANKVTLAYSHQQKALAGAGGASSAAYLSATDALMVAQDNVTKAQAGQGAAADDLKLKQDELTQAQTDLNDATQGTTDKLTAEQTAAVVLQLVMDKSAASAGLFGKTSQDQAQIAAASWEEAKTKIGDAINPIITKFTVELGGWLTSHTEDIKHWAEAGAQGLQKIADILQWMLDHKEVVGAFLLMFGVFREVTNPNSMLNRAKGLIDSLSGHGGSAVTPGAGTEVSKNVANMQVELMRVAVMEGGAAAGLGGGLGAGAGGGVLSAEEQAAARAANPGSYDRNLLFPPGTVAGKGAPVPAEGKAPIPAKGGGLMQGASGVFIVGMAAAAGDQLAGGITQALTGHSYGLTDLAGFGPGSKDLYGNAASGLGRMLGNQGAGGDSTAEQIRLAMQNAPSGTSAYQNALNLSSSKGFSSEVLAGDKNGMLEQAALYAKDQASKTTGAEKAHWEQLQNTYDTLSGLVQRGAIKTQDDLNYFLSHGDDLTKTVVHFQEILVADVQAATDAAAAYITSGAAASAAAFRGTQTGRMDATGGGSVQGVDSTGHRGVISQAGGAYNRVPTLAIRGDVTGGEWTLRKDQVMQGLVASAAAAAGGGAPGGGGLHIGEVHVNHPTSDVDPITAITRAAWHASYDERGIRPSDAGYRADQQLR